MPDFADLHARAERAKDLLIECSLALARAAHWSARGPLFSLPIAPGHWFARKARKLYTAARVDLAHVRDELAVKLPDAEVPPMAEVLGEELAWWAGLRPRLGDTTRPASVAVSARWEWPLVTAFDDPSLTFENRMETTRLEVNNLLEAVGALLVRLRENRAA